MLQIGIVVIASPRSFYVFVIFKIIPCFFFFRKELFCFILLTSIIVKNTEIVCSDWTAKSGRSTQ